MDSLFRIQFEGDAVEGTAEFVDGKYRVQATKTDGEAWHIKLESNYPTLPGNDYRITYRFHSDVAGLVKFGDFQEFRISAGDNEVTGLVAASRDKSYLDLQLGALAPFTLEFSEVEVEELSDKAEYESILPAPIDYESTASVYDEKDEGYGQELSRTANSITLKMNTTPQGQEVWKSKLFVKTGAIPAAGDRYRISADMTASKDADFETCFNNADKEKGYAALYGQHLDANEKKTIVQFISIPESRFTPKELILQFALGKLPQGSEVTLENIRVEKVKDGYSNILPSGFALDRVIATGNSWNELIPVSYTNIPLTSFSYTSTDSVFEGHDDGYLVRMDEKPESVTMDIYQAPEAAEDRGVWKAKLYVNTGVNLEVGKTYQVSFDLLPEKDQAEYEVCFDVEGKENAYGALYGRSLKASVPDQVTYTIMPTEDLGTLILRLQLGKTDTAKGNKVTFKNFNIVSVPVEYTSILPETFSYTTPLDEDAKDELVYTSILPDGMSYRTGVNVYDEHADGYVQSVSASGTSATLSITQAPSENRDLWNSKLLINTGFVPQSGTKYAISFDISAQNEQPTYEVCFDGAEENSYGALYDLSLAAGETKHISHSFIAGGSNGSLRLRLQLGQTASMAGNTVTVSNIQIQPIEGVETAILPNTFAYPFVQTIPAEPVSPQEAGYRQVTLPELSAAEGHDKGYKQTLNGLSLNIDQVPVFVPEVWKSKLFIDTGITLEAGAKYIVTANVTSEKAFVAGDDNNPFELAYNNGTVEKGYGDALYGQSIEAGVATSFVKEFTVASGMEAYNNLILQFNLGKSQMPNTFTVNSVTVEKYSPFIPLGNLEYSHHDCDNKAFITLTGNGCSIAEGALSDGIWKSQLDVNTNTKLEPSASYRVTVNLTSEKAINPFEILYNNGNIEKGYTDTGLYSLNIEAGKPQSFTHTFKVAEDITPDNLILRFQLGNSPLPNTIKINSITLEKMTSAQNGEPIPVLLNIPVSLSASQDSSGYDQSVPEGTTSLKLNAIPANGVWQSKLFVDTKTVLKPGTKYKVTANVTSTSAMSFEIAYNNGDVEKGYEALYGQSIAANTATSFEKEFTVASDADVKNLVLQFQLGSSPAPNTFTVNSVTLEEWVDATDPGAQEDKQVVHPGSFELWAHESYTAALSGNGSTATVTFTSTPEGSLEPWKTKLFAETGVTLSAGKTYRISADVQAASALPFEICYNNGGEEKAVGALYGLTATTAAQTVTFDVTAQADAALVIQFSLGNAASGNNVTVSNIKVSELAETLGSNVMNTSLTAWAPVHVWSDNGYAIDLSNTSSSATVDVLSVPSGDQADWKLKTYLETGAKLTAGKSYRISYDLQAKTAFNYNVFYNNGTEEKAVGEFYELSAGASQKVEHVVSPEKDAVLIIQLMLGTSPATNEVTISNVEVEEITTKGDAAPFYAPVNFWAHEDYTAKASHTDSSASLAITKVPTDTREAWKVKLFAETGAEVKSGKTYLVSVDVSSTSDLDFEICYNNLEHEKALGALYGLSSSSSDQTFTYTCTPEEDAVLTLQLNLGNAVSPNTVTISGIKVEEVGFGEGTSLTPDFRYDSTGYIGNASDDGYVVELDQADDAANFHIYHAPEERNPWNVKLNIKTGLIPKQNTGYRVSFEIESAKAQDLFEVFYDGSSESAYGALYEQSLTAGKKVVSYIIQPGESKGELSIQVRLGKTNTVDGNDYVIRNVTIDEVAFKTETKYETKPAVELWAHEDYSAELTKEEDQVTVHLVKTPSDGQEAWKVKLFIETGVTLKAGEKYRISLDAWSDKDAPFEVCYNRDGEEKGLGAIYGLTASKEAQTIEFVTYAGRDTHLVIQISLGNVNASTSFMIGNVRVEKAGETEPVSDTLYEIK